MASTLNSPAKATTTRLTKSHIMGIRNFEYACAASGILSMLFFLFGLVAAGFLPPGKPNWTPEQNLHHFRSHERGIQTGALFFMISGAFYFPFTALISAQIQRIPNVTYLVGAVQFGAGIGSVCAFIMPGVMLGSAVYRLDRSAEITQALADLFWINLVVPWPGVLIQNFAFAYAILQDRRPKPLFPKAMAAVNIFAPVTFVPSSALIGTKTGPMSWGGAYSFWFIGVVFFAQLVIDSLCLLIAIQSDPDNAVENLNISMDNVPEDQKARAVSSK